MVDLVIRSGTVLDGTGAPGRVADVALEGSRIVAVGEVQERGHREIDAEGLLVTPGWVDVHTHYDGQVSWDPLLSPSCWHGVTTVVTGNCGVGFAPVRPGERDFLVALMEGVEDIPGTALCEGITWEWETFPEYLDAVERMPHAIDVGAQVPHGALRAYVMGERGAAREPATAEDIDEMARLVRQAIDAGALGFSTSRTIRHRTSRGDFTPTLGAAERELLGIGRAFGDAGRGVFEMVSDFDDLDAELSMMCELAATTRRPLSVSLHQQDDRPEQWRELLERIAQAAAQGVPIRAQVAARAIGVMIGLEATLHPFLFQPTYAGLAPLPLPERVARLRDPEMRARILSEEPRGMQGVVDFITSSFGRMFPLGDPPDYEPPPEASVAAIAERERRPPAEVAYDLLLQRDGRELLYFPLFNYAEGHLDAAREMLVHPHTVPGLGDGGAHCGLICDASFPTTLVTHWTRDRTRGERLPLEWAVMRQARDTAQLVGLLDRGVIAPGMKADLNVIDHGALRLQPPEMAHDLPAGGKRLVQRAEGYRFTIVSGEVVFEDGEHTGALPGRLVRGTAGPRPASRAS